MGLHPDDLIAEADELRAIARRQNDGDAEDVFLALAEAYELLAKRPRVGAARKTDTKPGAGQPPGR